MRKILLAIVIMFFLGGIASAQIANLATPENLPVKQATKIEIVSIKIEPGIKQIAVVYRWYNASGVIDVDTDPNKTWICADTPTSTCYTDTFAYKIKNKDLDAGLGKAFRGMVWEKLKTKILTGANDATFTD